jgi:histidinol-phosphatase (PHP family)
MTIDSDFHSHVVRSSARQMVLTAREKGIRVLGLSEHIFQMREVRPLLEHLSLEGPLLSFAEYITAVQEAGEETGVDVRLGLEVDFIPTKNALIQAPLAAYPWDFLIGSVHEIDERLFEPQAGSSREEGELLWLRYFQLLREAASSGYFSVISHPVRMRINNPYLPPTLDDELEQLAAEATRADVALEINGYDMLMYPEVVKRLALACVLHRTPVSVSSDAHRPPQIAQAHQQSESLLQEVDIHKIRTWKQGIAEEYTI